MSSSSDRHKNGPAQPSKPGQAPLTPKFAKLSIVAPSACLLDAQLAITMIFEIFYINQTIEYLRGEVGALHNGSACEHIPGKGVRRGRRALVFARRGVAAHGLHAPGIHLR